MTFTIHLVTPISNKTISVNWLALETERGALVIQKGHRPLIASLKPRTEIKFEHPTGLVEGIDIAGGIVDVGRDFVTIVVG